MGEKTDPGLARKKGSGIVNGFVPSVSCSERSVQAILVRLFRSRGLRTRRTVTMTVSWHCVEFKPLFSFKCFESSVPMDHGYENKNF